MPDLLPHDVPSPILSRPPAVSPADVRAQLSRIVDSPDFDVTRRNRDFLRFVVEEALAGRSERIKAYNIAVEVLGRDPSFNASDDPIIRIEAAKLRKGLERYYLTAGTADPIRIDLPKGGYAPQFTVMPPMPARPMPARAAAAGADGPATLAPSLPPQRNRGLRIALLAAVSVLAAIGAGWLLGEGRRLPEPPVTVLAQETSPTVVVTAFDGEGQDVAALASGLTEQLIADLMRFGEIRVYAPYAVRGADVARSGAAPLYQVGGSVRRLPDRFHIMARLLDAGSGQVLWSETYDRPLSAATLFEVQAELSAGIVGRLAQPYGIITNVSAARFRQSPPATLSAYDCVLKAFAYRRSFAKDLYPPVRTCLQEAVRQDPGYAVAWAMLAFAHLDASRFALVEAAARPGEIEAGLAAARQAVALDPNGIRSQQSLAALLFMTGAYDQAEQVQRRAIALNPNDPESLAQLGWRLTVRGRWDEGTGYLREAVDRTVHPPPWYYATMAIGLYLAGDLQQARDAAEMGRSHCCGIGEVVMAITEAAVGHAAAARTALSEATRQAALLGSDPRAFFANYHVADPVIERLVAGIDKAAVVRTGGS